MERLQKKDADSGVESAPLTEAQKDAIGEARNVCEARTAERRILHQSALMTAVEPEARAELEHQCRRDLARYQKDRDRKISAVRTGSAEGASDGASGDGASGDGH